MEKLSVLALCASISPKLLTPGDLLSILLKYSDLNAIGMVRTQAKESAVLGLGLFEEKRDGRLRKTKVSPWKQWSGQHLWRWERVYSSRQPARSYRFSRRCSLEICLES